MHHFLVGFLPFSYLKVLMFSLLTLQNFRNSFKERPILFITLRNLWSWRYGLIWLYFSSDPAIFFFFFTCFKTLWTLEYFIIGIFSAKCYKMNCFNNSVASPFYSLWRYIALCCLFLALAHWKGTNPLQSTSWQLQDVKFII